jgi:hypothetical protein
MSEQVAAMKADWPILRPRNVDRQSDSVTWVGQLQPNFVSYKIELRLEHGWPKVRILSPKLRQVPGNPEGRLPHVYGPADDPTLCLFDPETDEWNPSMLVSRTIVPWVIDWIVCYEFWQMTGRWTGGGRHPGEPPTQIAQEASS